MYRLFELKQTSWCLDLFDKYKLKLTASVLGDRTHHAETPTQGSREQWVPLIIFGFN